MGAALAARAASTGVLRTRLVLLAVAAAPAAIRVLAVKANLKQGFRLTIQTIQPQVLVAGVVATKLDIPAEVFRL
jgi:hypothetical protein